MDDPLQTPGDLLEASPPPSPEELRRQRRILFATIGVVVLLLVFVAGSVYLLLRPSTDTARVADIFIIFLALESTILMFALVILIIQLSILINLLQNEIRPIISSTNETVSTLRGTAAFLSENLTEPVIKLNEYLAGFQHLFALIGIARSGKPKKKSRSLGE